MLGTIGASGIQLNRTSAGAKLTGASLVEADITDADLTGCRIYGVSAWNVKVSSGTKEHDLVITAENEPEVTVDNIEVAQFVYLLLHNAKIRDVIDTQEGRVARAVHRGPKLTGGFLTSRLTHCKAPARVGCDSLAGAS